MRQALRNRRELTGVIVTTGTTPNALGVIRDFGRRGIPVFYLDSERHSMVKYSKYITQRLKFPSTRQSESAFIDALLEYGSRSESRLMIIPTGDRDLLALSKYSKKLEPFYYFSLPPFETVRKLVNKKEFYQLLAAMKIAHPLTYLPKDFDELRAIGREIGYPFIVKPAYSAQFQEEFGRKCRLIYSSEALDSATERMKGKNIEAMIQEIVPGEELYSFYTYFNQESNPIAICGYDKLRQYPPNFGSGSLCRSALRPAPVNLAVQLLKAIGYRGIAEAEFIRDPRDGEYKLLEINARTTRQNRLPPECGVDVEYIAYLDTIGQKVEVSVNPKSDIFWVDDFYDTLSYLTRLREKKLKAGEQLTYRGHKVVHSIAAWDDLAPLVIQAINMSIAFLRLLLRQQ